MATNLTSGNDGYVADGGEVVNGLAGNDQIHVIHTEDGVDFDYFEPADIYGNQGNDYLVSYEFGDRLFGDSGNDTLIGGGGRDHLEGGSGNDVIYTGTSAYTAGTTDFLSLELDGDLVWAGTGDDTVHLQNADNDDTIRGEEGHDTFYLYNGAGLISQFSLIAGGSNAGLLASGFEVLHYFGGDGFEVVEGGNEADSISGGGGTDLISGLGGNDRLDGQDGADVINGGDGADRIYGGSEDDILRGDAGNDTIQGGTGNDTFTDTSGNDNFSGEDGNDSIQGGSGTDVIDGGDDNDTLRGGADNDTISDKAGNDAVFGEAGNDTIHTGTGNDTVRGGDGNDIIRQQGGDASTGGDRLYGDTGDDDIQGGSGDDSLFGGVGNDLLNGGNDADLLDGGSGTDTASYALATSGVTASLTSPAGNTGFAAGDSYVSIENMTGSSYDDVLGGDTLANAMQGGSGNDEIWGYGGNDTLTGGAGSDEFVFSTALGAGNVDTITDFVSADTIVLENSIFTVLGVGVLDPTAFKDLADGAKDLNDRIIYDSATGALYYDADGAGIFSQQIQFASVSPLTDLNADDFVII